MKHFVESQQFDRPMIEALFEDVERFKRQFADSSRRPELENILRNRYAYILFCEPSTRTRFSFTAAANYLGMKTVSTENGAEFSSLIKGGTLEDEIRSLCEFEPDTIILRHKEEGASKRAAAIIDRCGYNTSVINAGDGIGQHPSQSLLDLCTIVSLKGGADNIHVVLGGDLSNGRTVRSLVYLLTKYNNVSFTFVSPQNLRMKSDIIAHLHEHNVQFEESQDMRRALKSADVAYWTRVQTERGGVNSDVNLTIGLDEMKLMKKDAILLHPLPRNGEVSTMVDCDPRTAFFKQVKNGLFVRMALLKLLLSDK